MNEDAKASDPRLFRLAKNIEALDEKDELTLHRTREITALRRRAAAELFTLCAGFVDALNGMLSRPMVTLDPESFPLERFHEGSPNLIQVNVRGRILQIEFDATPELLSTEDFRIPYTLSGTIRAFNQELLDKDLIEEQLIFYTVEKQQTMWRYFDARTYHSGSLDRDYLISLMDRLVE